MNSLGLLPSANIYGSFPSSMADNGINPQTENEDENIYGVLLYYKYTSIPDLEDLFQFYNSNCASLSLLGRVRLSSQGVNVTVGGRLSALEKHIEAVKSNALFEGTDFKLASCLEPSNDQVAKECGFTSLSIRIVKELVTLSSHPLLKSPEISNAGRHLSAAEFHSVLQYAGKCQDISDKKLILLDARNLYETRIGKFDTPGIRTLDPEIRQYSDLPSWIDNNAQQLQGNNILMYCTGGIRCEMASAYIRSKGAGFENVFQLYGGIQRYMEQFPDGGFFKGKNFVFDHRCNTLGTCLHCGILFDDYTSRCRCTHCRMLVLVCDSCQEKNSSFVCELCHKDSNSVPAISCMSEEVSEAAYDDHSLNMNQAPSSLSFLSQGQNTFLTKSRKLRILCLHGFRQNASSFKGRTASLAKKLKNIAELVFIDAPHELPFIYNPTQTHSHESIPTFNHCNKKFAWLVDANYDRKKNDAEWKMGEAPFDPLQYQQQTEGFEKSVEYLKTVFSKSGPFDGILGFSQGGAMAALLSAHREKLKGEIDFRFAIVCSGFAVNMGEYVEGSIDCPSLHIFGKREGKDRQIDCQASRQLACLFKDRNSVIIEHDLGHIIPTTAPYICEIKEFLQRFR